jgi:serine/threonine-protein kinase
MGTVYSANDQSLARSVAVKVIRPEFVGDADLIARFHQEAKAAAGLIHPNVITIHDFGLEQQHPFIIMELLSGQTLRAKLALEKSLSPARTLEIMKGVCSAVAEAHRRRLLHRDLKPENIFITNTPAGEGVKVLDFGLVKAMSLSMSNVPTAASTIAGTPYYMAPELLAGEPASPASDVWALGVIVYEMLEGTHPFTRGQPSEWQNAASSLRQEFFRCAFQRDPALRTPSVDEFLAQLELTCR